MIDVKKQLAVFDLFVRSSLYKVLAVLCGTVILQSVLWWKALQSGYTDFRMLLLDAHLGYGMAAAWILITIILCYSTSTGNQNHLILRLSIRKEWFFIWQIVYNVLCYLLFWFVQAAVLYGAYQIFADGIGTELVNHQTLMAICYQSPMFHAFFPLSDSLMIIRNLLLALGMGSACAAYSAHGRYHKRMISLPGLFAPILALAGIWTGFERMSALFVIGISAAIAIISAGNLWTLVDGEEES